MNKKTYVFSSALAISAAVFLASSFSDLSHLLRSEAGGIVLWFFLLMTAGVVTFVALRGGGAVTGTAVVNFAIIITYGGSVAAWLAAVEMAILVTVFLRFGFWRTLFNVSQMVASLAIAGFLYRSLGGTSIAQPHVLIGGGMGIVLALVGCHLSYFFANTGLVTLWNSFRLGQSALRTWKANYLWMLPQSFAAPLVGLILAYVYVHLPVALVFILFLWLIYYARTSRTNVILQDAQRGTVAALATAVDSSLDFLEGESERVAALAVEIGRKIGLSGWRMQALEYAALLHDIGYLAVGRRILSKNASLTKEEWARVRSHAEVGASIVTSVRALERVGEIVRAHHERPDGRGYPRGLRGDEIPKEAAILKVADAFVAMTTPRPYRDAMSVDQAISKMKEAQGTHFDPQVVKGLVELYEHDGLERFAAPRIAEAA